MGEIGQINQLACSSVVEENLKAASFRGGVLFV